MTLLEDSKVLSGGAVRRKAEVDSLDELKTAVIDGTFEQRWIIDVNPEGATCRTCDHDCNHGDRVERALADHGLLTEPAE